MYCFNWFFSSVLARNYFILSHTSETKIVEMTGVDIIGDDPYIIETAFQVNNVFVLSPHVWQFQKKRKLITQK